MDVNVYTFYCMFLIARFVWEKTVNRNIWSVSKSP